MNAPAAAGDPIRRITIGAKSKSEATLPPQVEPINLYALNSPDGHAGAVLLDAGFYIPPEFQGVGRMPFPINYKKVLENALSEMEAGLQTHGYKGIDAFVFSHGHIDHMGIAIEFQKVFGGEFWTTKEEKQLRLGPANRSVDMRGLLRANGFADGRLGKILEMFPQPPENAGTGGAGAAGGWSGEEIPIPVSRVLEDDQVIGIGDERYRVCVVRGHSQGQALLVNETRPGDYALHGADQVQRNEPPTFLSIAGTNLGLAHYLNSMDSLFDRHPEYREIRRIYPSHARGVRLDRFEETSVGNLGEWWDLCRSQFVRQVERILEMTSKGATRPLDIYEALYAEKLPAFEKMGLSGLFIQMFHFTRMMGRLDLLETRGWDGAKIRRIEHQTEGGMRFLYERA
ncbi:MAG: MBL fold metallo-hydrolase [Bdellovibrionota bacterium]